MVSTFHEDRSMHMSIAKGLLCIIAQVLIGFRRGNRENVMKESVITMSNRIYRNFSIGIVSGIITLTILFVGTICSNKMDF